MALLTLIRDLHRRKARERRGLALAEGVRLLEELLAADVTCKGVAVSPALETTPRGRTLLATLTEKGIGTEAVSEQEMVELAATEHPQGVIAVFQPPAWALEGMRVAPGAPLVVLDAVQDPGNVGTIARTAHALGAAGLVALPGTADLTGPKVIRAAAGMLFRLPHLHLDSVALLAWCRSEEVGVWVTTMAGTAVERDAVPEQRIALVLGNEGAGISDSMLAAADREIGIPIRAETESLNVAVAAGILLDRLGAR